jgi:hypothetical protein
LAWQYHPGKEGITSGVILTGTGIGAFIFNVIAIQLINPEKIQGITSKDNLDLKPFPPEIANRVPKTL